MLHSYELSVFVDFPIDNKINMEKRAKGYFECDANNLKECLLALKYGVDKTYGDAETIIGVYGGSCDGKYLNKNYVYKVMRNINVNYWWC